MNAYVGVSLSGSGSGGRIQICSPTKKCLDYFKERLTFSNPEYIKKLRMGKWIGNTPKNVSLYQINEGDLYVPMGVLPTILENYKAFEEIAIDEFSKDVVFGKSKFTPYSYQEEAIEIMCDKYCGVLVAKVGSGKTNMALEIIARKGKKALWITHTKDLLKQSYARALNILGIEKENLGIISEGKVNIGSHITFATVQTLYRLNLQEYADMWGGIIVDECHKASTNANSCTMFEKVLNSLNSSYRFGITATPYRSDGFEKSMFAMLGDVTHEVDMQETKKTTCHVEVIKKQTEYSPDMEKILSHDGTISYTKLVEDLTSDKERNNLIAEDLNNTCSGGYTLVLSDRINHMEELSKLVNHDSWVILTGSNSKKSKQERETALQDLNSGKLKIVFATWKLAKEGLDIPNLRYLVQSTPQKDKATVIQGCGRVARTSKGKEKGFVLDYVDDWGMFEKYSKLRNKYYKEMEFDIT